MSIIPTWRDDLAKPQQTPESGCNVSNFFSIGDNAKSSPKPTDAQEYWQEYF